MKITNKEGVELHKVIIITICPIEYALEAKQLCADFINNGELPELMLNKHLRKNGVTTHCYCERIAYNDELTRQQEHMKSLNLSWIDSDIYSLDNCDITKMALIEKQPEENVYLKLKLEAM